MTTEITRLSPESVVKLWKSLPVIIYPNKHHLVVAFWLDTRRIEVTTPHKMALQIARLLKGYSLKGDRTSHTGSKSAAMKNQPNTNRLVAEISKPRSPDKVQNREEAIKPAKHRVSASNVTAIKIPEMSSDEAMSIVLDFNDIMDEHEYHTFYSTSELPYPKNRIKFAIRKLLIETNDNKLAVGVHNCGLHLPYYQDDVTEPVKFRLMDIEAMQKVLQSGLAGAELDLALEPFLREQEAHSNDLYLALQSRAQKEVDEIFHGIDLSRFD